MTKRSLLFAVGLACVAAGAYFASGLLWPKDASSPPPSTQQPQTQQAVCTGIVEAVAGEIDVFAQIPGELAEVRVTEGDNVKKGQVLAVVDARRFAAETAVAEANLAVARAQLKRIQAGTGEEEKQAALLAAEATEARLAYETKNLKRLRSLLSTKAVSVDDVERVEQEVERVAKQADSLQKHYAALRRGPIPEEVEAARAEVLLAEEKVRQAKINYEYRTVNAPAAGNILQVYRHAGDSVSIEQITPILRMVDASRLRIRLEIDEADAPRIQPPQDGALQVCGVAENVGQLTITTVIPQFGPKRLFNPDTSARQDTRTIPVLCEIKQSSITLYPGQRITASIPLRPDSAVRVTNNRPQ